MSKGTLTWFGVVRRKTGTYSYACSPVDKFPEQTEFLREKLHFQQGDIVVELLQSAVWDVKDFFTYCEEVYRKGTGK